MVPEQPAAGWYQDPDDHRVDRWWDGEAWQELRRERPAPVVEGRRRLSARRVLLGVVLFVIGYYVFLPIADGFHFGYNGATDHECLTRAGIQYCK